MSEHPSPSPRPRPHPAGAPKQVQPWIRRAALPIPTLVVFAVFALVLWFNAAVNHYRFNVALAVLASVPVLVLIVRGASKAGHAGAAR